METKTPVVARAEGFLTAADRKTPKSHLRALATKDHDLIQRWAERHGAEPATGEASASGPATLHVTDGGAGIRFNFPGFARFRPITWSEWFENFDRHDLTFVFEEEVADRAYEYWQARGGGDGHDRDDWFQAESEIGPRSGAAARYRLVKDSPDAG
jgi:hypothetical protein